MALGMWLMWRSHLESVASRRAFATWQARIQSLAPAMDVDDDGHPYEWLDPPQWVAVFSELERVPRESRSLRQAMGVVAPEVLASCRQTKRSSRRPSRFGGWGFTLLMGVVACASPATKTSDTPIASEEPPPRFATGGPDAEELGASGDAIFRNRRKQIADLAVKSRLPSVSAIPEYADAGGLVVDGADWRDSERRAAVFVDKVLTGASPAICRSNNPPSLTSSSTSKPPGRSGSPLHHRCSYERIALSNDVLPPNIGLQAALKCWTERLAGAPPPTSSKDAKTKA